MATPSLTLAERMDFLGQDERELTQLISALTTSITTTAEQQELAAIVRDKHKGIQRTIEVGHRAVRRAEQMGLAPRLKGLAEEEDREADRQNYMDRLVAHEQHAKNAQRAIRAALIKSKQLLDQRARDERAELLKGATVETVRANELRRRRAAEGNVVLNAASDVTDALRRTTKLMSNEVERSVANTAELEESSRLVGLTLGEHQSLSGLLKSSQTIITKLEQGDWTDRLIMFFGLFVFLAVVVYVLQGRFPGFSILRWLVGLVFRGAASVVGPSSPSAMTETSLLLKTVTETSAPSPV
ncbi:Vesicle transport protein S20 [Tieghemiomyces parasiticus]|uniref:Vesicle transport protein S20 n=1 Tax=Tieghemiomyces parasiticus TaxID=78921 RepID=A0A9W8AAM7_9FUNG|nr:Vesicle transport protein S20 [Tieghemiomyces parasiticus]